MTHGADDPRRKPLETCDAPEDPGRREMLRRTAGALAAAATAGLAGGAAAAQVHGTMQGGGSVPLRMPMGALNYLDRKEYVHNMKIESYSPGLAVASGEPLTSGIFARGTQRLSPGGGGFVDISDPLKPVVFSKGQFQGGACLVYSNTLRKWIIMASAAAPLTAPTPEFPRGKYHKEYAERSISSTNLRGIRTYDASDPGRVRLLQEFSTGAKGSGTHMNFYDGGKYAYLDCGWDDQLRLESTERPFSNGLMIVDLSDPANVKEVSRWWVPGQRFGEEEEYKKYPFAGDESAWTGIHGGPTVPVRVEDGGTVGYAGWGHFGFYVHDLTDITKPRFWGRTAHQLEGLGGIPYHTILPVAEAPSHPRLRNLVVGVFESLESDCREAWHTSYVIDVKDKRNPKIVGLFPRPVPHKDAPYADFCQARGRFSAHNCQTWVAPGTPKPNIIAMSYFNAGVRIYDISDPTEPREVAYFVPPRDGEIENFASWRRGTTEGIFIEWDRNLIWVTTHAGLYCLSCPALGSPVLKPMKVAKWSVPHVNVGWDDQTAASVYFGRSLRQTV